MTKAYLNALYEEGTRKELFDWVCKLDGENDQLRDDKRRLDEEVARLRKEQADYTDYVNIINGNTGCKDY